MDSADAGEIPRCAHGPFFRKAKADSAFVAGKAVIDAYNFEIKQDWVGIMLAPSALTRVPNLAERCKLENPGTQEGRRLIRANLPWSAFVQRYGLIPFHKVDPFDDALFDGFAIRHGEETLRNDLRLSVKNVRVSSA